jgi:hypothetical protein
VDGMDIDFYKSEDTISMYPNWFEDGPTIMGSSVTDALSWVEQNGEVVHLELDEN